MPEVSVFDPLRSIEELAVGFSTGRVRIVFAVDDPLEELILLLKKYGALHTLYPEALARSLRNSKYFAEYSLCAFYKAGIVVGFEPFEPAKAMPDRYYPTVEEVLALDGIHVASVDEATLLQILSAG